MARRWLLVTISTARATSTLRVYVWRRLRSLGGLYLQQSVCLLPENKSTKSAVDRLLARVATEGGEGRRLRISIADADQERQLIEAFQAERADEYSEVCSRTPAFLEEIEMERKRGRATYNEVEESEADLERLQKWLKRIEARDYFDSPGRAEAVAAISEWEDAFAEFEREALAAEAPEAAAATEPTTSMRLRA